jgi:hypothetical protein
MKTFQRCGMVYFRFEHVNPRLVYIRLVKLLRLTI